MRVVTMLLTVVLGALFSACLGVGQGDTMPPQENQIGVNERTRIPYRELLIGASNIWESDYKAGDGSTRRGMTALLSITHRTEDSHSRMVTAYPSLEVVVGNYKITVLEIRDGDPGSVRLQIDSVNPAGK